MKILRITSRTGSPGGVEQYIKEVNTLLKGQSIDTYTLELNASKYLFDHGENSRVINVNQNPLHRLATDSVPDETILKEFVNLLDSEKPDILHLHRFRVGYASITRFLRSIHIPVIFTAHDAELICPLSTLVIPGGKICEGGIKTRCFFTGCRVGLNLPYEIMRYRRFMSETSKYIDLFLTPSDALRKYFLSFGLENTRRLRSFVNFPSGTYGDGRRNTFGFIGRLVKEKGLDQLVSACLILKSRGIDFKLIIAGSGDYSVEIERAVKANDLGNNIEFIGPVYGISKEQFYSDVQFTVVPTLMFDNIPLSVAEGMMRNRPVVASDIGGVSELVENGVNGLLVKPYDVSGLATAIEYMFTHSEERAAMGIGGDRKARTLLDPEKHITNMISIYEEILNKDKTKG